VTGFTATSTFEDYKIHKIRTTILQKIRINLTVSTYSYFKYDVISIHRQLTQRNLYVSHRQPQHHTSEQTDRMIFKLILNRSEILIQQHHTCTLCATFQQFTCTHRRSSTVSQSVNLLDNLPITPVLSSLSFNM